MDVEPTGRHRPQMFDGVGGHPDQRWSGRARRLIERCHALCLDWATTPLRVCLDDLEQKLFEASESAHDPFNQQRHFNSRQRLQSARESLEKRFAENLTAAFMQLGAANEAVDDASTGAPLTLSLVDPAEHEMTVALEKLAARGEAKGGAAIYELGFRMAVLVGTPPLEGGTLPMGPLALAQALRGAASTVELPVEHDLLLLRCLEAALLPELPRLYGVLNESLQAEGILPQLRPYPLQRAAANPRAATATGAAEAAPRDRAGEAESIVAGAAGASRSEPIAVLDSLRELLARRRSGPHDSGGEIVDVASPEELQTALSALQQHLTEVTDKASRELRSAQLLREELLAQLNAGKPAGAARTGLSAEQGDTVELVAMLFEQLSRQLHQSEESHALLGGLQLPVLRMAVTDKDFFEQKEHPARQLLGTVTEAAQEWLDDSGSDADRSLHNKLEQLVERASREPPSADLYTALLADIQQHLALLSRKAQAAERRHIEAMQGRERLDQARQRASALIGERFAQSPPRGLLRALLDRAWSDVLALTLLRHGEDSEVFTAQLTITDQLLGRKPVSDRAQLQADVETGLQQIGMHHEEAAQVAQRLANPGEAAPPTASGESLSTTDLAMRLKQHQRLGEHQQGGDSTPARNATGTNGSAGVGATRATPSHAPTPAKNATPRTPAGPPRPGRPPPRTQAVLDPREVALQETLRLLPFGRWFEFTDPKTGRISQRKLAWFSPVSGQTLFVNRRGVRAEEMTLPQLAHEIVAGRAREVQAVKESVIDRAWRTLTRSLLRQPMRQPSERAGN